MKIHHVAVTTTDPERLAEFYQRVLRLPRIKTHHEGERVRSIWLGMDDAILMIERASLIAPGQSGWHLLALAIDPAERSALKAHVQAQGVTVEAETDFTFYLRDPDGNRIGLSHYPEKATTLPT